MGQVGFGQGGHTVCALISPMAVPGDYDNTTYGYSVLRTLEDGPLGLSRRLSRRDTLASRLEVGGFSTRPEYLTIDPLHGRKQPRLAP